MNETWTEDLRREAEQRAEKVKPRSNGEAPALVTTSAAELERRDFAPVRYIQHPILPTGVTLLAGKPKMGKSWLALQLAIATAQGHRALNLDPQLSSYGLAPGGVLYLALEDNDRRMKSRIEKQGQGFPPQFQYTTAAPRGDECIAAIRAWLESADSPRLVIVDTLQKIRTTGRKSDRIYETDYEDGGALKPLADEHDIAIVVVHHLRKGGGEDPLEQVSGTLGLVGSVDTVWVMRRERGAADAFLYVTGRDIAGDVDLALEWREQTATWRCIGSAAAYSVKKERADVLEVMREAGEPVTARVVQKMTGKKYDATRRLMERMAKDGTIRQDGGSSRQGYLYVIS